MSMLIPMVLANRAKAWVYAAICTVGSVIGGIVGYAIGYFLYETLGQWVINAYGLATQFEAYRAAYNEWGLWIILIKGLTPIPYKLVTIASGAAAFNFWVVHRRLDRHARRALLSRRRPPILVRRAHSRVHRAPAHAADDGVRGGAGWRFRCGQVPVLSVFRRRPHAASHVRPAAAVAYRMGGARAASAPLP